jgi:hypothetical protein
MLIDYIHVTILNHIAFGVISVGLLFWFIYSEVKEGKELDFNDVGTWAMFDLGLACENIMLRAHEMGLGTVIVGAPGIVEYRNKLLEENKGRLEDPAVIAGIDAKLVQYDKDYLANDDSMDFLIKDKSFKVVRKRLFGMHGAEAGFNEDGKIELIDNSLDEGWNPLKFPAINNNSRVGSYNRGFQTQLGGEAFKWLLRASANINITENDCGTKLGIPKIVLNDNLDWFVGHSIVHNNKLVFISSEDDIKPYIGKEVIVRSPMFCKLPKTDYCQVCAGKKLSANPEAASMAVSDYGSAFLGLFMAAMHGKELAVAKMNWRELIF